MVDASREPAQISGSEITLFSNDEFTIEITPDGNTFRVRAPGIAKALGYYSARDMLRSVPEDEKGWEIAPTPGGDQRVSYLTEGGFNRVLGQRQAARVTNLEIRDRVSRFQKWVFNEVLPAIRRGEVVLAQPAPAPRNELEVLRAVVDQLIETRAIAERATAAALDATEEARVANARIDAMEGRHNWWSALGYSKLHGLATDNVSCARLGKVAASFARAQEIEPNKVQHSHYGLVNEFPEHIWDLAASKLTGGAA